MTPDEFAETILQTYEGVTFKAFWGDQSFFYNPGSRFANGAYFATMKLHDGENDSASNINRPGVWRLNIGLTPKAYKSVLGDKPARPARGEAVEGPWDFTSLDTLMPHPCYGWMGWVAILSPSAQNVTTLKPLLDDAYGKAVKAFDKRVRADRRR